MLGPIVIQRPWIGMKISWIIILYFVFCREHLEPEGTKIKKALIDKGN